MKETSFTCSLVNKLNTKKLLVILECLKDRAFDRADCLRSFVIRGGPFDTRWGGAIVFLSQQTIFFISETKQ